MWFVICMCALNLHSLLLHNQELGCYENCIFKLG